MPNNHTTSPPNPPERTKLDFRTSFTPPEGGYINAHITGTPESTAGILRRSWQHIKNGRCIASAASPRTYYYDPNLESWPTALNRVINLTVSDYEEDMRKSAAPPPLDTPTPRAGYTDYFCTYGDVLKKPTWADSTWTDNYRASVRRICRMLDDLDSITIPALAEMRRIYIREVAANKNSKGAQSAERRADAVLVAADYCLTLMVSLVNETAGAIVLDPVPIWDILGRQRHWQAETAKWIPEPVIVRLAECLFRFVADGRVMGIALMMCMGLRTSESVAVLMGELQLHDGYVTYEVRHQGPDRCPVLKSHAAYRIAIGGRMLYDLVVARRAELHKQGYSDERIDLMPAVSFPDTPTTSIDIRHISTYARELLFACGYSVDTYELAIKLMEIEPDYEADDSKLKSVSAYIFRRNYATMICNICDLMPGYGIEDYLLGHVLQIPLVVDPKNPDIQRTIAERLDRWVIHPHHTSHPFLCPISLSLNSTVQDLGKHIAYRFVVNEDIEVELHVETTHPDGTLNVSTTGHIPQSHIMRCPGTIITPEDLSAQPTILMPLPAAEYSQYVEQAQQIELNRKEEGNEDKPLGQC